MADEDGLSVGDVWAKRPVRVVEVIDSGRDLRVVDAETGRGRFDAAGDHVFPEHLRSVGYVPLVDATRLAAAERERAAADALREAVCTLAVPDDHPVHAAIDAYDAARGAR